MRDILSMNNAKRTLKLDECRQAFNDGDAATAERLCQALLRTNRADADALHILGVIAASRHDYTAAAGHLARCVVLAPRNALFHNDLARVHALAGRYEQALTHLERAALLQPGERRTQTDLADVLERSGRIDRARELLQPFMDADQVDDDMAPIAMRLLDHAGQTEQAIALAKQLLAGSSTADSTRRFLLQLMGRLCEKTGDHRGAFEAFAEAKQTERHFFSPAEYEQAVDDLIETFSAETLAKVPRASKRSDLPVFIACMPRSGSTLVEQIIHAHPQAYGGGETTLLHNALVQLPAELGAGHSYPQCLAELKQADVDRLANGYLQSLKAMAPAAARITNKHLLNYLNLGAVSVLFPGARVIHIRRNRLDNGMACFMASLSPAVMPWASDLRHIGLAWRQYERLMDHWRRTLDLNLLEVQYEDLVNDTEAQIRRIIDFCGLPWDDRCLRYWEAERVVLTPSYDQVRRPIFRTALDRWRKYEEFLGPLKEALGDAPA
jgi:tetratricopeptide (TPR) repeat protein